jgi:hypothetical protein
VLERVEHGFVIVPDFKVTSVDDRIGRLAGGYAGWRVDKTLLVGGGGYLLTNESDDMNMAYAGLVVEWLARTNQRVRFGAKGLVGGGRATLGREVDLPGALRDRLDLSSPFARFGSSARGADPSMRVPVHEPFFIFEPEANLLVMVTDRIGLSCGLAYRVIGAAPTFNDRLKGLAGTLAIQLGGW